MNEIVPGLLLGDLAAATDGAELARRGVTHVVDCGSAVVPTDPRFKGLARFSVLRGEPGAPPDLRDRALGLAGHVLELSPRVPRGGGREIARGIGELVATSPSDFSYFTAPAGHTFLWRLLPDRKSAVACVKKLLPGDKKALEWAESVPLTSARELKSYH